MLERQKILVSAGQKATFQYSLEQRNEALEQSEESEQALGRK